MHRGISSRTTSEAALVVSAGVAQAAAGNAVPGGSAKLTNWSCVSASAANANTHVAGYSVPGEQAKLTNRRQEGAPPSRPSMRFTSSHARLQSQFCAVRWAMPSFARANTSVERTTTGKPAVAAHLQR